MLRTIYAFINKTIFLFILSIAPPSYAQETQTRVHPLKKNFYQLNASYQIWQEVVDAKSTTTSTMRMQFHGFKLGASLHQPLNGIRWVGTYGLDLGLGIAKGKADSPLTDEVKDQPWLSLAFTPGILYRGTARSELGLVLPIVYRKVMWRVEAPFSVDAKSFSAGLGGVYVQRFNLRNSFSVSVVHQQMWKTTVWSIGWQTDLR
ncbi:MAG: hypothetical protein H6623_09175 [Bdellovibrionaceae bacterium]|nr:hypothetical protein [Pseudobdellovibrionaceae bacterium]